MIVAITEFTLMQPWRLAAFMRFAIPSANQAKNAEGNLHARTNADSWHTHRTISAWTSMEAMQKYMMTGAHMKDGGVKTTNEACTIHSSYNGSFARLGRGNGSA